MYSILFYSILFYSILLDYQSLYGHGKEDESGLHVLLCSCLPTCGRILFSHFSK